MKYFMSILVLAFLFCSAPIFGQTKFAIRGGWNLTNFSSKVTYFGIARESVKIGASMTIPMWNRLSLQFGGDYVSKGADSFIDYKIHVDYIEFSGLATVTLIVPRRLPSFSTLIGPTVAFKVRTQGTDELARRYWRDQFEFKTLDFGIAGGIGMQMAISDAMILKAELLWTEGIRSINKTAPYDPNFNAETSIKNRGISVCVGFGFPYGKRN